MSEFYHDICSDGKSWQVGVYYDTKADTALVNSLPDRDYSMTIKDIDVGNPVLLRDGYIAFRGGHSNVYGVINYKNETFWVSKGNAKFCGLDADGSSFVVQLGKELYRIDLDTGEKISSRLATKQIEAMGRGWMVESTKSKLVLSQGDLDPIAFPLSNCAGDIVESNGYIIFNDRQGPLRVVTKGTNEVIQEIIPEPDSEFSRFAISPNGLLTYTQHYFEQPTTTYVHQRLLSEGEDLNLTIIGLSGANQLINDGAQIMFATCRIYDATTGEELSQF